MRRISSAGVLYPNQQRKGLVPTKPGQNYAIRPPACFEISLGPFLFLNARKGSLASRGLGCGWDLSVVKRWRFFFFLFHKVLWLLDSDCSKKTCHFSSTPPASPSLAQKVNEEAQGWQEQAASLNFAPKLSLDQGEASAPQQRLRQAVSFKGPSFLPSSWHWNMLSWDFLTLATYTHMVFKRRIILGLSLCHYLLHLP